MAQAEAEVVARMPLTPVESRLYREFLGAQGELEEAKVGRRGLLGLFGGESVEDLETIVKARQAAFGTALDPKEWEEGGGFFGLIPTRRIVFAGVEEAPRLTLPIIGPIGKTFFKTYTEAPPEKEG